MTTRSCSKISVKIDSWNGFFLQLNPDSNLNIIYYFFSVGYYSTHGSQRFRRTPFKDCLIWMQCELSKCKFVCIVCDTFALITCAYLENVSFVQEQNRLPLRREINTQTGCMYKSKENMIVCCRKSAFLKIIWRKGGQYQINFCFRLVKRNLLCIEDSELRE